MQTLKIVNYQPILERPMKALILFVGLMLCFKHVQSQSYPIQKLSVRGQKTYFVKDQYYNFAELEYLFQNDKELSRLHRAGVRNDVVAKIFGYSTLSLWGVGVIAFVSDNSHTEGLLNAGGVLGVILIVLVSPVTGTIGLFANANEVFRKKKLINTYNNRNRDEFGRAIEYPKMGLAKSGLGITICF